VHGTPGSGHDRLEHEILHGQRIAASAESVWSWDSPAGRERARRRGDLFIQRGALGPGVTALELGCGTGLFLEHVARTGASVRAIDISPDLLARARERVARFTSVQLDRGDAERLPYRDGSFDVVYGSSVLHHLDVATTLSEAHRVLRPGGRIVFAEPNLLNPQIMVVFNLSRLRHRLGLSPDEKAFTRFAARRHAERAGFVEVRVLPFDFLHPWVPGSLIRAVERLGGLLERLPLVREVAGSMLVVGRRA
jgi:SAM-dependent methyltransferase